MTSPSSLLALEGKLTEPQVRALQWLANVGGWNASWWGGSPFAGWPKEMRPGTYGVLCQRGLIVSKMDERGKHEIRITDKGRAALVRALKGAGE